MRMHGRSLRVVGQLGIVLGSLMTGCIILIDPSLDGGGFNPGDLGGDAAGFEVPDGWGGGFDGGSDSTGPGGLDFDAGGGSDTDAGAAPLPATFPGSGGANGALQILWFIRIDRGTANLAAMYDSWLANVTSMLKQQGFEVGGNAVAPLYGGNGAWLWTDSGLWRSPCTLSDALQYFAANDSAFQDSDCTATSYLHSGLFQSALITQFSASGMAPEVADGALSSVTPGAVLVFLVDTNARPFTLDDPSCQTAGPVEGLLGDDVLWQPPFSDLPNLSPAVVRYVFAFTPEGSGASLAALQTQCADDQGFPQSGIDSLAPSPLLFFDPLLSALPGTSLGLDLCNAPTTNGLTLLQAFLNQWVSQLTSGSP